MTTPINLNKVRKEKTRRQAKATAQQNRVAFGRTKAEKDLAAARAAKDARDLAAKKREP